MKRGKKVLSLFLAAAIAVSGINFAGVFEVNAANEGIMTVTGEGTVTDPEGTVTNPEGTVTNPEGTVTNPEGTVTNPEGTEVNRTALKEVIDEAEGKTEADYTAESWAAMQEKLTAAKAVYAKADATQTEVDEAKNALRAAIDALVQAGGSVAVNKDALKTAIANAKAKRQADYTAESWTAMQTKLTAAENVNNNANATQQQVDQATSELNAAVNALVRVTPATVNKAALKAAIDAAGRRVQKDYTADTWTVFQRALANARTIYAKANATQAEVDNALRTLKAAENGLKAAPVKVTKVTITNGKTIKIAAGKKVKLSATVAPKNATNKAVTWSISKKDKKYATLKGNTVTTKKAGAGKKVKITATAKDGSNKKATITISIMKNAVTKVTLKAKKTVKAGKKITVKAIVKTNGKKANKTLKWSLDSKSAKFASVNKKGVVSVKKKAKKGATIKVTAAATDGSNKKATIKIKVTK